MTILETMGLIVVVLLLGLWYMIAEFQRAPKIDYYALGIKGEK